MFHPTARRLDEPYRLYGFTIAQWLVLLLGGGGLIAGLWALHVSIQVGGFLGTLVLGIPGLYWLLGESGRIDPAELLVDAVRRLFSPQVYEPGPGVPVVLLITAERAPTAAASASTGCEVPW